MTGTIWEYGYRTNDDANEYHHLGNSDQFTLAIMALQEWNKENFYGFHPEHLMYITEVIDGEKHRSLNLEEWDNEGISPLSY